MSTRLYFLVHDEEDTRQIVDDLRSAGIDDSDLHGVAHRETYPLEGIPEANFTDRTDFLPAARRGVALGGTTGFLAGLAAVALPAPGLVLAGGAMVATLTAAGGALGTWGATLVGIGITHRDLKPFEEALEAGRVLMLADVPEGREEDIKKLIQRRDADIVIAAGELSEAEESAG